MALYALVSPGGSPGVTTTALALALTWPGPVLVAECDPGGCAILAGLFAGQLPAGAGLLAIAFGAGRSQAAVAAALEGQLEPLDQSGEQKYLAGITDPRQAPGLAPAWPAIAAALADRAGDVIADCGRLDAGPATPLSVLTAAAMVVMVMRPSLRQTASARIRIDMLSRLLGGTERVGVLLAGKGDHRAADIASALGVPVIGSLPDDTRTAAVLSDGAGRRNRLADRPLMRAAAITGKALRQASARYESPAPASAQLAGQL